MNFRDAKDTRKPMAVFAMSSLTDIVLLLLIFFLLTSSFVANLGIRVDVPRADTGAPPEQQHLNVTITKEGGFYVGGDEVPRTQLGQRLRQENQARPQSTLVLRADKEAILDDAVYVMNIARALDMRITIATELGPR